LHIPGPIGNRRAGAAFLGRLEHEEDDMQLTAERDRELPVPNQIAFLEMSLQDARLRLQSAVSQGVHPDDRLALRSEVVRILDEIAKLKTAGRLRRQGA
jgi:hypothetical protein